MGGERGGKPISENTETTQTTSAAALAKPRYSDFALDQDTVFCLDENQEIRLFPRNVQ